MTLREEFFDERKMGILKRNKKTMLELLDTMFTFLEFGTFCLRASALW